jgi:hypothetical protein
MALFLALLPRARLPADFGMLATILVSTFGFSQELGRPSDGGEGRRAKSSISTRLDATEWNY